MNSKQKGDFAEAIARAFYVSCGYEVFDPVGSNQPYDLLVGGHGKYFKIQIKYAGSKGGSNPIAFVNKGRVKGIKQYKSDSFDILFCVTPNGDMFEFLWEPISHMFGISPYAHPKSQVLFQQ